MAAGKVAVIIEMLDQVGKLAHRRGRIQRLRLPRQCITAKFQVCALSRAGLAGYQDGEM